MPSNAPDLTPAERKMRAQIAAHRSWANTPDRVARTQPGRDARDRRFLDEVDPDRVLPEDERAKRAANARQAYFLALSLKGVKARRKARERREREAIES